MTRGLSRLLGDGLVTSEDPLWRTQRKLAAPSFQPRHIAAYAEEMVRAADEAPAPAAGPRDIHHDMTVVTLQIALCTLFGSRDPAGEAVGDAIAAFMTSFEEELRSLRRLLPPGSPPAAAAASRPPAPPSTRPSTPSSPRAAPREPSATICSVGWSPRATTRATA